MRYFMLKKVPGEKTKTVAAGDPGCFGFGARVSGHSRRSFGEQNAKRRGAGDHVGGQAVLPGAGAGLGALGQGPNGALGCVPWLKMVTSRNQPLGNSDKGS